MRRPRRGQNRGEWSGTGIGLAISALPIETNVFRIKMRAQPTNAFFIKKVLQIYIDAHSLGLY
jgi:hypothetical protein